MSITLIRSHWIAPMDGRVIEDGAVAVLDDRIVAVGSASAIRRDICATSFVDAGDALIVPGLVNAHVHLELSDCTPGDRPAGGLEAWLARIIIRSAADAAELEKKSADAALRGAAQCLRFGISTVGDITRQAAATRAAIRASPLRVTSFGEVSAMASRRDQLEPRLAAASDASCATERLRIGISPHSPYSIEIDGYRRCLEVARERRLPLATHLAETRSEWEFLASHTGPLKALWDAGLGWDEQVPRYAGGPIRMAEEIGLLEYGALLAHVNYCSEDELARLARSRSSVVYCPRTHEYFGHPPHPFKRMHACGINVALGTDSCASSPNLNLLDDARLVHATHSEISAEEIWQMLTLRGAKALGLDGELGSLAPGKLADFAIFPAGPDPLRSVLESGALPIAVWINGQNLASSQARPQA